MLCCSHKPETALYYDNRLSEGTVVVALCKLISIGIFQPNEEEKVFSKLALAVNKLSNRQDPDNNLWNTDGYLVTSTLWGISAFLDLDTYGRTTTFSIQEGVLYNIVKESLRHPSVVKELWQIIQGEMLQRGLHKKEPN